VAFLIRVALVAIAVALAVGVGVALAAGNPAAGEKVYAKNGCGTCHTFKPARSKGTIGPPLAKARLLADAKLAKQKLPAFVRTSIVKPSAFIPAGQPPVMPATYGETLSKKELADLIAFILKG
jgi:mono/diheme cytochrome c family protein